MLKLIRITVLLGICYATHTADSIFAMDVINGQKMKDQTLDEKNATCKECLISQGVMWSDIDDKTSKQGRCFKAGQCVSDSKNICSQPVSAKDNAAKWQHILTNVGQQMLNMQMIAYCPQIADCGTDGGHKIVLTEDNTDKQTISLTGDKAIKDGEGESCYWELVAPSVDMGERSESVIMVEVTKLKNMIAYGYAGNSRLTSTLPSHKKNKALVQGQTYFYSASIGQLIVALPITDDTEFEFKYWIASTPSDGVYLEVPLPRNPNNHIWMILNIIALAIMMVLAAQIRKIRMDLDDKKEGFFKSLMMQMKRKPKDVQDISVESVEVLDEDAEDKDKEEEAENKDEETKDDLTAEPAIANIDKDKNQLDLTTWLLQEKPQPSRMQKFKESIARCFKMNKIPEKAQDDQAAEPANANIDKDTNQSIDQLDLTTWLHQEKPQPSRMQKCKESINRCFKFKMNKQPEQVQGEQVEEQAEESKDAKKDEAKQGDVDEMDENKYKDGEAKDDQAAEPANANLDKDTNQSIDYLDLTTWLHQDDISQKAYPSRMQKLKQSFNMCALRLFKW